MEIINSNFSNDLTSKSIRICDHKGEKFAAVLDIIQIIVGSHPSRVLSRLQKDHSDVISKCEQFRFQGQGQSDVHIANAKLILEIIFLLPGKKALEYRKNGAQALLQMLNPTEQLIEELQTRLEHQSLTKYQNNLFIQKENQEIICPPRQFLATFFYIRVRYPDNYLKNVPNKKKAFTLDVIKFGITQNLQDRTKEYNRDEYDNGFMLYSYLLNYRQHAQFIESIMRHDFTRITMFDSFEYINTTELAKMLKYEKFDNSNYISYLHLAEKLFFYAVRLARSIWPDLYDNNATIYNLREQFPKVKLDNKALVQTELVFIQKTFKITNEDLGFITFEEHQNVKNTLQTKNRNLEEEVMSLSETIHEKISMDEENYDEEDNISEEGSYHEDDEIPENINDEKISTEIPNANSSKDEKCVIERDIITGVEVEYDCSEKAAIGADFTPSALRRTYLNQKRQLFGKHYRNKGRKVWQPMKHLHFDRNYVNNKPIGYIKSENVETKEIKIFENVTSAAIVVDTARRALNEYIDKKKVFQNCIWSTLDSAEWGEMVDPDDHIDESIVETLRIIKKPLDGKCIETNIETKEEKEITSISHAAGSVGVTVESFRQNLLNKPRQACGKYFRTPECKEKWIPPKNLTYNKTGFESHFKCYVKVTEDSGKGDTYFFETLVQACKKYDVNTQSVKKYNQGPYICKGVLWTKAEKSEFDKRIEF